MFITDPTNIDYLISDVRLRIGDLEETRYSDTIVRSALIGGIKYLQSRWLNRYMVYTATTVVEPQPSDVPAGYIYATTPVGTYYIPSGLSVGDIYRNPTATDFADTSTAVIAQIDETPVILAAVMVLSRTQLSSSAASFVNWSDGEYSYSNVASSSILSKLYADSLAELNSFFKTMRARPVRDNLPTMLF